MDNAGSKGGLMRLKILPSSLRERRRYIKLKIISDEPIAFSDFKAAVTNVFLDFYGELGFSELSLTFINNSFDPKRQVCILRCNHKSVQKVLAALGFIQRLGDVRILIKILGVSGTLKKLRKLK